MSANLEGPARRGPGGIDPADEAGRFARALQDVTLTRRPLRRDELDDLRAVGVDAAEQGTGLRELVDRYLASSGRFWSGLPPEDAGAGPAEVHATAAAVLRALIDAVDAVARGHETAQRLAIRREEAFRREFIDDLLGGRADIGSLAQRADRFGLQLAGAHTVAVARADGGFTDSGHATRRIEAALGASYGERNVLVASKDGLLVCVVPATSGSQVPPLTAAVESALEGGDWRVGVGQPGVGLGGVAHSYEEARQTLDLADRLGFTSRVVEATGLLVYQVLLRDRGAITDLVRAVLGPLEQARGGPAPLLETLRAYFATGGVTAAAARRLHLSIRAVTYRLDRVHQLTGYDTGDPAGRFTLEAAVLGAQLLEWPDRPL